MFLLRCRAEFEAAKRDIFKDDDTEEEGDEKPPVDKKLFFRPRTDTAVAGHVGNDDCTMKPVTFNLNKNFPTKHKTPTHRVSMLPKPTLWGWVMHERDTYQASQVYLGSFSCIR